MIGYIVFGAGIGVFVVALAFWIYYLTRIHKYKKLDNWREAGRYNVKMCFAGIWVAAGALIVNIGNLLMKNLH